MICLHPNYSYLIGDFFYTIFWLRPALQVVDEKNKHLPPKEQMNRAESQTY